MSSFPHLKTSASFLFAAVAFIGCGGPDLTPKQQATVTAWMNWAPETAYRDLDPAGGYDPDTRERPLNQEQAECLVTTYLFGLSDPSTAFKDHTRGKIKVVVHGGKKDNDVTTVDALYPTDPKFVSVFEECTGRKFSEDFSAENQPGYKPAN